MSSNNSALEVALSEFKRSAEITRDVRFQANLRLSSRQRNSSYIVSLLSLYVIGMSLIPNIWKLEPYQNQLLLACSVVLSVFVIFTSLIDGSQNFFHQGELLHQCARKVATVHHNLKSIDPKSNNELAWKQLKELQEDYKAALDDCPANHDNVDFYREKSTKPHLFPINWPYRWKLPFVIWNRILSIFWGHAWMAPHLLVLAAISYIIYSNIILTAPRVTG